MNNPVTQIVFLDDELISDDSYLSNKASWLIDELDENFPRMPWNGVYKNPDTCPEYYCMSKALVKDGVGHILWVDFKPGLHVQMAIVYFENIHIGSIFDLIIKIFAIGAESVKKITLLDEADSDFTFITTHSKMWH